MTCRRSVVGALLRDDPARGGRGAPGVRRGGRAGPRRRRATRPRSRGFAAAGLDADETRRLLRRSVELAREAGRAPRPVWVAASVGPYGAARADGSEYTGGYGTSSTSPALRRFHRERLRGARRRRAGRARARDDALPRRGARHWWRRPTGRRPGLAVPHHGDDARRPRAHPPRRAGRGRPSRIARDSARRGRRRGELHRPDGVRRGPALRPDLGRSRWSSTRTVARAGMRGRGRGRARHASTPWTSRTGRGPGPASSAAAAGSVRTRSKSSRRRSRDVGFGRRPPSPRHAPLHHCTRS